MDQALIQKTNSTTVNDVVEYEVIDGMPVMPEHLKEYDEMRISPDDAEVVDKIARESFEIWKANNYQQVEIVPEEGQPAPACYGLSAKQAVIFDADEIYPEDYDSPEEYEKAQAVEDIHVAAAKKMCAECPLQKICLTSSITRPSYGRGNLPKDDEIRMELFGVWGGWGPGAREIIIDRFVQIWGEEDASE